MIRAPHTFVPASLLGPLAFPPSARALFSSTSYISDGRHACGQCPDTYIHGSTLFSLLMRASGPIYTHRLLATTVLDILVRLLGDHFLAGHWGGAYILIAAALPFGLTFSHIQGVKGAEN